MLRFLLVTFTTFTGTATLAEIDTSNMTSEEIRALIAQRDIEACTKIASMAPTLIDMRQADPTYPEFFSELQEMGDIGSESRQVMVYLTGKVSSQPIINDQALLEAWKVETSSSTFDYCLRVVGD